VKNTLFSSTKTTRCAIAIVGASLLPFNVMADELTLTSPDGTVNLVGELIEFSDNHYFINTAVGPLRVSAEGVQCNGATCPVLEVTDADVTFAGSDTIGLGILPRLMTGYAQHVDAQATIAQTTTPGAVIANIVGDDGSGKPMGRYVVSSTTTGQGFGRLADKSADIGMSSRRINSEELRILRASGAGEMINPQQEHVLAVDSLVILAAAIARRLCGQDHKLVRIRWS